MSATTPRCLHERFILLGGTHRWCASCGAVRRYTKRARWSHWVHPNLNPDRAFALIDAREAESASTEDRP